MGIFINKEASKKRHCQVPPLPTCIALLISHSKALFESLHIWHLHVFFFFPHKSFGSRSFFFIFLFRQNQSKFGLFQPVSLPAMGDLCGFWLVSVQIGAESNRNGDEKNKNKEVVNWRVECKLARQNESGAGVATLEPHLCFPDCLRV